MLLIQMGVDQLVHDIKPKHIFQQRPGRVGSLGDTVVKTRFRQSTPFMPWAYDPYWAGDRANKLGSNVQDGNTLGHDSLGGPARTFDTKWTGNRSFKHQYGFEYHDIRSLDKSTEPVLSWLGDFSWRRKLANTSIIKRTGSLFNVQPHGYSGKGRGGNYPYATTSGGIERTETDEANTSGVVSRGISGQGEQQYGKQPIIGQAEATSAVRQGVAGLDIRSPNEMRQY
jgi:hypothetical protein